MSEKLITLENTDLNKLFGSNNIKFNTIKTYFPQVKLISRGDKLKVIGSEDCILFFENKFNTFIKHLDKYNSLTINQIERIIDGNDNVMKEDDDVILHGKMCSGCGYLSIIKRLWCEIVWTGYWSWHFQS